ncbi:MAG: hypothetical protein D6776_01250, partial [Planctomycetota bacterium]
MPLSLCLGLAALVAAPAAHASSLFDQGNVFDPANYFYFDNETDISISGGGSIAIEQANPTSDPIPPSNGSGTSYSSVAEIANTAVDSTTGPVAFGNLVGATLSSNAPAGKDGLAAKVTSTLNYGDPAGTDTIAFDFELRADTSQMLIDGNAVTQTKIDAYAFFRVWPTNPNSGSGALLGFLNFAPFTLPTPPVGTSSLTIKNNNATVWDSTTGGPLPAIPITNFADNTLRLHLNWTVNGQVDPTYNVSVLGTFQLAEVTVP